MLIAVPLSAVPFARALVPFDAVRPAGATVIVPLFSVTGISGKIFGNAYPLTSNCEMEPIAARSGRSAFSTLKKRFAILGFPFCDFTFSWSDSSP